MFGRERRIVQQFLRDIDNCFVVAQFYGHAQHTEAGVLPAFLTLGETFEFLITYKCFGVFFIPFLYVGHAGEGFFGIGTVGLFENDVEFLSGFGIFFSVVIVKSQIVVRRQCISPFGIFFDVLFELGGRGSIWFLQECTFGSQERKGVEFRDFARYISAEGFQIGGIRVHIVLCHIYRFEVLKGDMGFLGTRVVGDDAFVGGDGF